MLKDNGEKKGKIMVIHIQNENVSDLILTFVKGNCKM